MEPERWKRVDHLLQSVLQQPPDRRETFLREACGGDEALRREVESLLQSQQEAGSFLDNPAMDVAARAMVGDSAPKPSLSLPAGTRLGSYEIVAQLGVGGMGEVYRARDTTLRRDVA